MKINNVRKKNIQALLGMLKIRHLSHKRNVKPRVQKSEFQKAVLKNVFTVTRFPSRQTREDLAILLNHTPRGIQIWFQNQRNKMGMLDLDTTSSSRSRSINDKKMTIDISILTDIVEYHISLVGREYWDEFINYDSEAVFSHH
ncbi:hypothetical protein NUSPORA_02223 [Nucleospora cyclopteri]